MYKKYSSTILFFLALSLLNSCKTKVDALADEKEMLRKSCEYLWGKQKVDGGWHSEVHGMLKAGNAYTPFVLYALGEVSDEIYEKDPHKIDLALQFIVKHLDERGALGIDTLVMEYPNYATAYALRCMVKYGDGKYDDAMGKMKSYLISEQFIEHRGIQPDHLAYGCWGFGETGIDSGITGHVDLSHTRRVLQALNESGVKEKEIFEKGKMFLFACQKNPADLRKQPGIEDDDSRKLFYDGGFYYSPIIVGGNKGDIDSAETDYQAYYRSYATATCDGVLALLAAGYSIDDEPLQSAFKWLEEHPRLDIPEGIPTDQPEQWHLVMHYYHLYVRAEVYGLLNWEGDWRDQIFEIMKKEQEEGGWFSNEFGAPNKEDDPMLATAMCVIAMNNALKNYPETE